jgi:RecA/RadA recombinase
MDKPAADRTQALRTALAEIDKQFGKGSILKLGDAPRDAHIDVVSTGSLGVDLALGVGGLPRGRIVEVYGPESSGKIVWRQMARISSARCARWASSPRSRRRSPRRS